MCAELRRAQTNQGGGWHFNFWRDQTSEADFLLHRAGRFHLADAKWTEHPGPREARGLRKVAEKLPNGAVETMRMFCRTPNPYPIAADVGAVPRDAVAASSQWG